MDGPIEARLLRGYEGVGGVLGGERGQSWVDLEPRPPGCGGCLGGLPERFASPAEWSLSLAPVWVAELMLIVELVDEIFWKDSVDTSCRTWVNGQRSHR